MSLSIKPMAVAEIAGISALTSGTAYAFYGTGDWFDVPGWGYPGYGWVGYPANGGYVPHGYAAVAPASAPATSTPE